MILCKFLAWDSHFFGQRIARFNATRINDDEMRLTRAWCDANLINCLYLLIDSDHPNSIQTLTQAQADFVDIGITLECQLSTDMPLKSELTSRTHRDEDIPLLKAIAEKSYQVSRFYFDKHFPDHLCDKLYEI